MPEITRRNLLGATAGVAAAAMVGSAVAQSNPTTDSLSAASALLLATPTQNPPEVNYCINTSTVREQNIGLEKEIELAAKVGYGGIEPWIRQIDDYKKSGGKLSDLKKKLADSGLKVESAIGFANWIVDDETKRKKALEQAKREMDLVAQIGGTRIAAPPAGATNQKDMDLFKAAERYADLIKVGREIGVTPQVEVWGFSKTLNRLGQCVFVAIESGCEDACILPDVYHIYKGGSDFEGLGLLAGNMIQCFHMNDYPADPPRETINDSHRVYPGDGVAPIAKILKSIFKNGFKGALSLELFNRDYWKQDVETVFKTGLKKMKAVVAQAV